MSDGHVSDLNQVPEDMRLRVGIFIVAYNAVTTLSKVLDRIPTQVWDEVEEVYVFDDCSQDDTELLGLGYKAARGVDKLKVFRNPSNLGYGGNQKQGYAYAIEKGFDYVVLLHGDGQYAPEMLPEFLDVARRGRAAAVFGSRMMEVGGARRGGMPLYKYVGNRILTVTENALLGSALTEFHSGYRMYSVEALKKLHFAAYTDDFHFDTQIIVELFHRGLEIVEIPIPTYYGDEICYVNGMKYAADVVSSVLQYKGHSAGLLRCDWLGEDGVPARKYPVKEGPLSSHQRIVRMVAPNSRVLDLGAEGTYVQWLKDKGCTVVGVNQHRPTDPDVALYDDFVVADLDGDCGPTLRALGHFDYVLMADVLEHLRGARELVSLARDLCGSSGAVIASTGNVAHWFVRLGLLTGRFNYHRRGILDETHVHLYTKDTFRELFEHEGYEVRKQKVTPIPFELLTGKHQIARVLSRSAEYGYYGTARAWPGLFAYQIIVEAKPER